MFAVGVVTTMTENDCADALKLSPASISISVKRQRADIFVTADSFPLSRSRVPSRRLLSKGTYRSDCLHALGISSYLRLVGKLRWHEELITVGKAGSCIMPWRA